MKTFLMLVGLLALGLGLVYVSDQSGADKVVVEHVDHAAEITSEKAKEVGTDLANAGIDATRDALDLAENKVNGIQGTLPSEFE